MYAAFTVLLSLSLVALGLNIRQRGTPWRPLFVALIGAILVAWNPTVKFADDHGVL